MQQYLIRIVFVSEVSCKFCFVTFNMAPLLGISFSFSDLIFGTQQSSFFHHILTNIPSSMTSTIFLSIFGFISIFASVLVCKQSSNRYQDISRPGARAYVLAAMLAAVTLLTLDLIQRSQLTSL